ncbi:MAG: glycosyltransferase family 4 protein [Phycisphaerales bacterium]
MTSITSTTTAGASARDNRDERQLRAAFVTLFDASDVTKMSGTGYNISQALISKGLDLQFIGSLKKKITPMNVLRHGFNRFLLRKNDMPQRDTAFLKHYARQVEQQLQGLDVDLIFASGTLPISYLDTDLPLVLWTDCTFENLLDYYPRYCNLSARSIRDGHSADKAVYERLDHAIFTSSWAADSAIKHYGMDPQRTSIVSRGANVPAGRTEADIEALIDARPKDRCILHFVGIDWLRKGGDIALRAAELLNQRGIPTELRVAGVEPETDGPVPGFVKPLGYVSKSTPEGLERFMRLMGEAHFMILPTRADAYGFAFLEASAFGVPSLAPNTGGVPLVCMDGVNGCILDYDDRGEGYADKVEYLFNNPEEYKALAMRAFRDHLERGNWDVVGKQLMEIVRRVVDEHHASPARDHQRETQANA